MMLSTKFFSGFLLVSLLVAFVAIAVSVEDDQRQQEQGHRELWRGHFYGGYRPYWNNWPHWRGRYRRHHYYSKPSPSKPSKPSPSPPSKPSPSPPSKPSPSPPSKPSPSPPSKPSPSKPSKPWYWRDLEMEKEGGATNLKKDEDEEIEESMLRNNKKHRRYLV